MMRAGDNFTVVNRGKVSFDAETFSLLYLPIIGRDAFAAYQVLRVFSTGRISYFLEYLNVGLNPFAEALDHLTAMNLLRVFDNQNELYFELKSPLNFTDFLADDFYKQLLISRIGESKVTALSNLTEVKGQEISKKFHEVYAVKFDGEPQQAVKSDKLDMASFKSLMTRQKLTFANENEDSLGLYSLAEKFDLNWYELFKNAEQTANADGTLNLLNLTRLLAGQSEPRAALSSFAKPFQDLIVSSKSVQPEAFIRRMKQEIGGFVSNDELKILSNLTKQNLPNEVQNVLIHYVLVQQSNASLTANFVNQLANDWLRHKVFTAEAAVSRILEHENQVKKPAPFSKKDTSKKVKKAPEWSHGDYVNETSADELAKLEKIKEETLKRLQGGD